MQIFDLQYYSLLDSKNLWGPRSLLKLEVGGASVPTGEKLWLRKTWSERTQKKNDFFKKSFKRLYAIAAHRLRLGGSPNQGNFIIFPTNIFY